MHRLFALILVFCSLFGATPALAEVKLSFHSFNGSVIVGRYPHTFIVLEGTLDETGEVVSENYGFTAKSAGPSVLNGPVEHDVMIEKPKYITKTNRHFTITLTDAQYRRIKKEVAAWRDAPGKFYDLDTRNCIHFVGKMAEIAGLKVDYPKDMLRRPKKWLNYITALNPRLGARQIK
ncbi:hypothetical protein P7228_04575 [Altererythrobacter arenosus]|uniref:DUF4105 domain-containing protein n=1 Tax=Altererythrobacter arenosus TaxID=3032592 RepID=A0ABY8FTM1_9SPHN|nr:hypothetical protein [Altererythrobacter sp. CAU 1644]WFL78344.1 hypothetical protein P7228_04575 [Altererythrobacter sp. CAU 1644]